MAKLFFYIGVWLTILLSAGSEEKHDVPKNAEPLQPLRFEFVTYAKVINLLIDSIQESRKL